MIWINLRRIVKSGFTGFWRNSFVSLSAVFVMTVTLFTIGALIFIDATLQSTLTQLREKVDVNVYFVTSAREGDILAIQEQIRALPEVASVEYVSRAEALAQFRKRHQDDQLTLQALDELDENPLGAVLNIRAKEPSQYESVANFLETDAVLGSEGGSIIDNVNFFQNKVAIERLSTIIDSAEALGLATTIFLAILSILITFNTIRLAIYTARDEISVMRLVGASNTYARGPFIVEGILAGAIAGVITLAIFYPLTLWVGPFTESFFSDINLFDYYMQNFFVIFLIIIGAGTAIGAISSYLAVRRHLKI